MEDEKETYKTIAEIELLNDNRRTDYLKEQWGISDLRVRGRLEKGHNDHWWLTDVRSADGTLLRYPLADFESKPGLGSPGVYVCKDVKPVLDGCLPNSAVSAQVRLASTHERDKWKNPLLIAVDPKSIERLTHVSAASVHHNRDGSIELEDALFRGYVKEHCSAAQVELERLAEQVDHLKQKSADVATDLHTKRRERDQVQEERDAASQELAEIKEQHQRLAQEVEDDFASKRKRHEQDARAREAELAAYYHAQELAVLQALDAIDQELAAARKERDRQHDALRTQSDALRAYVKTQIEPLHRLELIGDAQWDALFPNDNHSLDVACADWPEFDGDTRGALAHLQRYLFRTWIGYPWDLLANFHALLCTGDLIILSGLSGSGKTNLVKSYAKATGNVAKIISVKPNWTSAEDLIGFYNPLQRAYTVTPFIEALFAASRDPARLHIICLDEMNLARVEYYFADFLSQLEERENPCIDLYPDDEAGHVLTELRVLIQALLGLSLDLSTVSLETLLADRPTMAQLAERLALADGESFPQLHARIRRSLTGALTVPSRLPIPPNVRFVGAVNMDDTTHYLSPKVLDRAHVLQFQSPLKYWEQVKNEVGEADPPPHGLRIPASCFPARTEYPRYDPADPLVLTLTEYGKDFLAPLGIELGMRPLRQAMLYRDRLAEFYEGDGLNHLVFNNLLRQKLLPRFSFDGKQPARARGTQTRAEIVDALRRRLADELPDCKPFDAKSELDELVARADDKIFNYWA